MNVEYTKMITTHIRKQGGAAIITIPSDVLKILSIGEKRYTLAELLQGATTKNMKILNEETEWSRKGKPVGRELL